MRRLKFKNRADAGAQLSSRLLHLKGQDPVILALPRGGVPVGFEVAKALEAPMDLVLVRKIGVPWQPELAVAAVVDGGDPQIVENREIIEALHLTEDFIKEEAARQLEEIERRRRIYLGDRIPAVLKDRTVVMVDDGIATGATVRVALQAVRKASPQQLVLAVPVAPLEALETLRDETDEFFCLTTPVDFGGISSFYADFHQVQDEEVVDLLNRAAEFRVQKPQTTKP